MQPENRIAIFDGHNDAVQHIAEYQEEGRDFLARSDRGHIDLPRAKEGGLVGGLFAMFARPMRTATPTGSAPANPRESPPAGTVDPANAGGQIDRQLDALSRLIERSAGKIGWARTADEVEAAVAAGVFAIVLHLEGAEPIGPELEELQRLYDSGLRSLGLVWSRPNIFGHGVPFAFNRTPDTGPGLTDAGKELVLACNRLGVMVDLSHLNEQGFWDVAALSTAPLVATHSCAHAICPATRNLTDRQLDAIGESDGVVGLNFCVNDLRADGVRDENTPLDAMVRQIDYLVGRLGEDRVAFGSDFDGTLVPREIKDASGLQSLVAALRLHGFDSAVLKKIAFDNWMRVLRLTLNPGRDARDVDLPVPAA